MEELEEVKEKYKLSQEEHDAIFEQIVELYLYDKFPVENPKAIVNIAPPASGKTGLNGFSANQFPDNNVVIINSDELKPFHPKVNEIAKKYPQYYTKVTDQESNTWTSDLFDKVLREGYNVIFEGTGKNARILQTLKDKMQGYQVTVRGMAVNELNCLMSILERYENQLRTKGLGRLVILDHFYETYENMPNTIDEIEKSGVVDAVEIYKRGETPATPKLIYSSTTSGLERFPNARYAVLGGRVEDFSEAEKKFEEFRRNMQILLANREVDQAEKEIFFKILAIQEMKKKRIEQLVKV